MSFHTVFEPWYKKFTLPQHQQQELLNRFHNHYGRLKEKNEKLQEPVGWSCEVESSFVQDTSSQTNKWCAPCANKDDMGANEIFQHYIFRTMQDFGWEVCNYQIGTWFNCYGKKHYQEAHTHCGSQLSGVYFLSYDPTIHGAFSFINPLEDYMMIQYPKVVQNSHRMPYSPTIFSAEHQPDVLSGDLIIFPSWFKHRVLKTNDSHKEKVDSFTDQTYPKRITISFNINFYDWFSEFPSTAEAISLQ